MNTVLDIRPPQHAADLPSLAGLGREGLAAALGAIGVPDKQVRMRVGQLWSWIYARGATSFDQMSDVSKDLRATLAHSYTLARPKIAAEQVSTDGTRKWLMRLAKRGHEARAPEIETVYIPEYDRGTLCISSQVGCTLTCTFCHTGTQRLVRNLEPEEIVGQILLARDRIGDWPGAAPPADGRLIPDTERKITNVVLMGMGEPLYNFDSVRDAMAIAADGDGLAMSKRRITLSTSGVVPEIPRWGAEAGTMLAISLHATRDELRDKLVPDQQEVSDRRTDDRVPRLSGPLQRAPHHFRIRHAERRQRQPGRGQGAGAPAGRHSSQDQPDPVQSLARHAPTNARTGSRSRSFAEVVNQAGYASPVRMPRGRDIMAACGQLKSESLKMSGAGAHGRRRRRYGSGVMRAVGRILWLPIAFLLSAAVTVFVILSLGQERIVQAVTGRGPDEVTLNAGFDLLRLASSFVSAQALLPALLLVIIGEVARIRGSLYYVVGGGAALAVVPLMSRLSQPLTVLDLSPVVWQVLATAGFAGGFVYWLLAGRNA